MTAPAERPTAARRYALIAIALAGLLMLAAGGFLVFALQGRPQGAAGTVLASVIGGPFQLVDQNGKPFGDADLKGKWHLVFFGYTHCPDTCPTTLNDLALALERLGEQRNRFGIVFITVDPERDTPDVLKSYAESFDAPVAALTGSAAAVAQAARAYRVYYARHDRSDGGYDMDHSAVIYLMDPEGRFAATMTPDMSAEAIATRLKKLLS